MKRVKILYGLEAVGGGALKHLVYLVTNLDRACFDITIILTNKRNEDANEYIEILRKSEVKLLFYPISKNINIISDAIIVSRLVLFIKKERFDIVHAHSSKAGGVFRIASFISGVKNILYTPHCFYYLGLSGIKRKLFVHIEKFLGNLTTYVIISEGEFKETARNQIVAENSILTINNAINFNLNKQNSLINDTMNKYNLVGSKFIVGAIGRLTYQKDWKTYIFAANEVLKTHKDIIFLIVGDGELKNDIQNLILKLKLEESIILTGYVEKIHEIYGMIDVLVNTSIWEGLPYVILEAMNYKRPVVATDVKNKSVVRNGKSGFTVPIKDYKTTASRICELIDDRDRVIKMGNEGYNILIKKYSFEKFVQKHSDLYKSLGKKIIY